MGDGKQRDLDSLRHERDCQIDHYNKEHWVEYWHEARTTPGTLSYQDWWESLGQMRLPLEEQKEIKNAE